MNAPNLSSILNHRKYVGPWRMTFVGLATVAVLAPTPAKALDGKTYPGAMCQPGELNSPSDIDYTWEGHAKNVLPANSLGVVCPIVRENVSSTLGINLAYVRVSKTNSTGVVCELRSRNPWSTAGYMQTQWNFEGAGIRTITFNGPANGYHTGYYVLSCHLPPGHKLLSYRIDEK